MDGVRACSVVVLLTLSHVRRTLGVTSFRFAHQREIRAALRPNRYSATVYIKEKGRARAKIGILQSVHGIGDAPRFLRATVLLLHDKRRLQKRPVGSKTAAEHSTAHAQ